MFLVFSIRGYLLGKRCPWSDCILAILEEASNMQLKSIAFPALGTGTSTFVDFLRKS